MNLKKTSEEVGKRVPKLHSHRKRRQNRVEQYFVFSLDGEVIIDNTPNHTINNKLIIKKMLNGNKEIKMWR